MVSSKPCCYSRRFSGTNCSEGINEEIITSVSDVIFVLEDTGNKYKNNINDIGKCSRKANIKFIYFLNKLDLPIQVLAHSSFFFHYLH